MSIELIKPGTRIDFIGRRYWGFAFSAVLILVCVGAVIYKGGPRLGVDFAGGLLMQVRFQSESVDADAVRASLAAAQLPVAGLQSIGQGDVNEYLINLPESGQADIGQKTAAALKAAFGQDQVEVRRTEMVGPKVGQDLRQKALYALYYSILMILIYISGRFEKKWGASAVLVGALLLVVYLAGRLGVGVSHLIVLALVVTMLLCYFMRFEYALGAILALAHDVIVTVGIFSLLDKEITLSFVAAILTIVGYSLNDTIIIFDRIREHVRKVKKGDYAELINNSINETLSRTILTSGSTLVAVGCLYLFGGAVNSDFALALFIGIGIGTFSSIFISAPVLLFWKKNLA